MCLCSTRTLLWRSFCGFHSGLGVAYFLGKLHESVPGGTCNITATSQVPPPHQCHQGPVAGSHPANAAAATTTSSHQMHFIGNILLPYVGTPLPYDCHLTKTHATANRQRWQQEMARPRFLSVSLSLLLLPLFLSLPSMLILPHNGTPNSRQLTFHFGIEQKTKMAEGGIDWGRRRRRENECNVRFFFHGQGFYLFWSNHNFCHTR